MGKFDGVLLATDFDDTLVRSNLTSLETTQDGLKGYHRNLEALDYFIREGGRFTVSTGRVLHTFAPHASHFPINAPAVLANGALLYDFRTETELFHARLPFSVPSHVEALAKQFPDLGFETHLGGLIYTHHPNEIIRRHVRKLARPSVETPLNEIPLPWTKLLLVHEDHELLVQAQQWIQQTWPGVYEAIFSNDRLLELTAAGANKGKGVQQVAKLLGIAAEHIYCIGDNQNDIPMLAVSAIPFAPANCAPAVREWGASIVCSCDDGAMADMIKILDKRY